MKESDIEILGKVASALELCLPVKEYKLFQEYSDIYERLKTQSDKAKERKRKDAEYHREYTRQWRQESEIIYPQKRRKKKVEPTE